MPPDPDVAAAIAALRHRLTEAQRVRAAQQTARTRRMREDDLAMRARTVSLRKSSRSQA